MPALARGVLDSDRRRRPAEPPAGARLRRLPRPLRLGEPRPPDPVGDPRHERRCLVRKPLRAAARLDCASTARWSSCSCSASISACRSQITAEGPADLRAVGLCRAVHAVAPAQPDRAGHLAGLLLVVRSISARSCRRLTISFLGKRFTGLLQLTYSLVIAYGMFLTLVRADRAQIAAILLSFCLAIIIGCLLENLRRPAPDQRRGPRQALQRRQRLRRRSARRDPVWPRPTQALHLGAVGRHFRLHALLLGVAGR